MLPTSDQGIGIFWACLGLGILLWFARRAGFHVLSFLGFNFQRFRKKTDRELEDEREERRAAAEGGRRQLADAFLRYSEAAIGMVAMVEASGAADRTLGAWFDIAAASLAAALSVYPEDHFRVSIWADLTDPSAFRIYGSANFDRNDPRNQQLSRADTIGGHAYRSKAGEYLCVDITKDRRYKVRSATPRPYKSIFAIRVGERGHAWGVVTIDAPRLGCFDQQSILIVRRFARLISAGAAIAVARYAALPAAHAVRPTSVRPVAVPPGTPPARIVSGSAAGASEGEETGDGGSGRPEEGPPERRDRDDEVDPGGDLSSGL